MASGAAGNPFTKEQMEALESLFAQFPRPCSSQRTNMKNMFPVLSSLDDTQLKAWFQTRNSTDLVATNRMMTEENARLVKEVDELLATNAYLKQQLND